MLDIKFFQDEGLETLKKKFQVRNVDFSLAQKVIDLNEKRKTLIKFVEGARAQLNVLSKDIGAAMKEKRDASALKEEVAQIKSKIESSDQELAAIEIEFVKAQSIIPNFPSDDVPVGKSEIDNKVISSHGKVPHFDFAVLDHVAIGENMGMMDFSTAVKITGSRFVILKKDLAKLERALINFMLDEHLKHGYEEINPPFIVHETSLYGTGQLPKFAEDLFKLENVPWYLIPTAEIPVTNLKREEIIPAAEFPLRYVAYTPCFRSEAGSYGKDTRGMIRLHQFNKVELVNIVHPDFSDKAHQEMIDRACSILDLLELSYRRLLLCTGDMGFGAQKTVDLEVWLPSQNCYREISSVSNCGSFQSRRAQIRFRGEDGKPQFAHTLNGSGLAVGRTLVAILENYQQKDGSVLVPKALVSYMGGQTVIRSR
jgi:seryl-tRNA synthetase